MSRAVADGNQPDDVCRSYIRGAAMVCLQQVCDTQIEAGYYWKHDMSHNIDIFLKWLKVYFFRY